VRPARLSRKKSRARARRGSVEAPPRPRSSG
jgi:hypothetical protein